MPAVASGPDRHADSLTPMPRRSGVAGPPVQFLARGRWGRPDAALVGDATVEARYAFAIAQQLRAARQNAGMTLVELAAQAAIHPTTIQNIENGRVWPDVVSLARLEAALDRKLWPTRKL